MPNDGAPGSSGRGGYLAAITVAAVAAFVVAWQSAALRAAGERIARLEVLVGNLGEVGDFADVGGAGGKAPLTAVAATVTTPAAIGAAIAASTNAATARAQAAPSTGQSTAATGASTAIADLAPDAALEPAPVAVAPIVAATGMLGSMSGEARAAVARRLLEDPEYQRLLVALQREQVREEYAAAARRLGLDAAATERFYDLLAEQGVRASERWLAGRAGLGDPVGGEDLQARADRDLAVLLGGDGLLELQRHQAGLRGQSQARAIQASFAARGVALTPVQMDTLAPRLAAAQAESRTALRQHDELAAAQGLGPAQAGGNGSALARYDEDTKRFVAAVRPVVSTAQLAAYESIRAQQRLRIEAKLRAQAIARETTGTQGGR